MNHTGNGTRWERGWGRHGRHDRRSQRQRGGRPRAIGAATGALAGGLIGNADDAREERDAALAQANYEHQARIAQQYALTNSDVARMTQSGVSDSVIAGSIQSREASSTQAPTPSSP